MDFNYEDIINPKKNRRVAELLDNDRAKKLGKTLSKDKIKIGGSSIDSKTFKKLSSNNLNFDNPKLNLNDIKSKVYSKGRKLKQNLSHVISDKGTYVDGLTLREKNHSGGLFFEKGDVKIRAGHKKSRFAGLFGGLFRKADVEFVDFANYCRAEMEMNNPELNVISEVEENQVEPKPDDKPQPEEPPEPLMDKMDIISQLQRKYDIKNVFSHALDEKEEEPVAQPEEESDEEAVEVAQKPAPMDLKSNVLSEFKKIFED